MSQVFISVFSIISLLDPARWEELSFALLTQDLMSLLEVLNISGINIITACVQELSAVWLKQHAVCFTKQNCKLLL